MNVRLHHTTLIFTLSTLAFSLIFLLPTSVFAGSATMTWASNTESDLAGYKIYKRALPSQDFGQPIFSGLTSTPSSPTTTVTGLSEGTTYGFIVTAFDTSGNESAPSIEKHFTLTTGTTPPPQIYPTSSDFNGDGKMDLIWRNTVTGAVGVWLMNGTTIASTTVPSGAPLEWSIMGRGDVDGDGQADFIWRNTVTGAVAIWLMNGTTIASTAVPSGAPLEWKIQ